VLSAARRSANSDHPTHGRIIGGYLTLLFKLQWRVRVVESGQLCAENRRGDMMSANCSQLTAYTPHTHTVKELQPSRDWEWCEVFSYATNMYVIIVLFRRGLFVCTDRTTTRRFRA
jgi:hypothetical protein